MKNSCKFNTLMLYILIRNVYICSMEKITLAFNTPTTGQVTISLGENSHILTNAEYTNIIEPKIVQGTSEIWRTKLRNNIEKYFKENLEVIK